MDEHPRVFRVRVLDASASPPRTSRGRAALAALVFGLSLATASPAGATAPAQLAGPLPQPPPAPRAVANGSAGTDGTQATSVERANTPTQLSWSTFLGGVGTDFVEAIAVDEDGNTTVTGWTGGHDFPTTPGAYQTLPAEDYNDAFVAHFSAQGTLRWCTLLGGTNGDTRGLAVLVGPDGEVWVAGETEATDFPTTPGAWKSGNAANGWTDAFLVRLSPSGDALLAATLFGGEGGDGARALALRHPPADDLLGVDAADAENFWAGNESSGIVLGGWSRSLDTFGTAKTVVFGPDAPADTRGFLVGFDDALTTLDLALYLDGSGNDEVDAIAVRGDGVLAVAGQTDSADFPTTPGVAYPELRGNTDNFVALVSSSGKLMAATYLGGTEQELAAALDVGPGGQLWIAGASASDDFPTTPGAADNSFHGGSSLQPFDAFVTRLDANLEQVIWSTFLGGDRMDLATAVHVDAAGRATVVGDTGSSDFPVTPGAWSTEFAGGDMNFDADAFLARLSADGTAVPYATFLGGSLGDGARGVALVGPARVVVAGVSQSLDLPVTAGAYQSEHGGSGIAPFDGFLAEFDLGSAATWSQGGGLDGAGVFVRSAGAEPGAAGLLLFTALETQSAGAAQSSAQLPPRGIAVLLPVTADARGELALLIPNPAGTQVDAKVLWASRRGWQAASAKALEVP